MSEDEPKFTEIKFLAEKIHIHHWPLDTPSWSDSRKMQVDQDINKNKEKKQIVIKNRTIKIGNYEFNAIKQVGITIPLFKKQSTLVFEGHCNEFDAHVHITTKAENYLDVFNKLMSWRAKCFPETVFI